jgi:hypothetical protein
MTHAAARRAPPGIPREVVRSDGRRAGVGAGGSAPIPGISGDELLGVTLARCARLVRGGDPFALALDIGDIDLPPVVGGSAQDQAMLRELAPLYLAAELEATGLLPLVEALAALFATGALAGDPGAAGRLLHAFHVRRRNRLTADERQALFGRVFGTFYGPGYAAPGGRNAEFEPLFIDLTEAMAAFDRPRRPRSIGPADHVRLHTAASALAANLVPRAGGITAYAAREVIAAIRESLEILGSPHVQAMLGARSVWTAVDRGSRRYLGRQSVVAAHVNRARAGVAILSWLADVMPRLGNLSVPLVSDGHPAVAAAMAWVQATLSAQREPADTAYGLRS